MATTFIILVTSLWLCLQIQLNTSSHDFHKLYIEKELTKRIQHLVCVLYISYNIKEKKPHTNNSKNNISICFASNSKQNSKTVTWVSIYFLCPMLEIKQINFKKLKKSKKFKKN